MSPSAARYSAASRGHSRWNFEWISSVRYIWARNFSGARSSTAAELPSGIETTAES